MSLPKIGFESVSLVSLPTAFQYRLKWSVIVVSGVEIKQKSSTSHFFHSFRLGGCEYENQAHQEASYDTFHGWCEVGFLLRKVNDDATTRQH